MPPIYDSNAAGLTGDCTGDWDEDTVELHLSPEEMLALSLAAEQALADRSPATANASVEAPASTAAQPVPAPLVNVTAASAAGQAAPTPSVSTAPASAPGQAAPTPSVTAAAAKASVEAPASAAGPAVPTPLVNAAPPSAAGPASAPSVNAVPPSAAGQAASAPSVNAARASGPAQPPPPASTATRPGATPPPAPAPEARPKPAQTSAAEAVAPAQLVKAAAAPPADAARSPLSMPLAPSIGSAAATSARREADTTRSAAPHKHTTLWANRSLDGRHPWLAISGAVVLLTTLIVMTRIDHSATAPKQMSPVPTKPASARTSAATHPSSPSRIATPMAPMAQPSTPTSPAHAPTVPGRTSVAQLAAQTPQGSSATAAPTVKPSLSPPVNATNTTQLDARPAAEPESEPVRIRNPFDASEIFEFPPGTSQADARESVAAALLERARDRIGRLAGAKRTTSGRRASAPARGPNNATLAQSYRP
jgi:hypothetical protein